VDQYEDAPITDPAMALVSLGVVLGLAAGIYWGKVARSVDTSSTEVRAPDYRDLSIAAALTALALFLSCGGFLFGRLSGRF
jgi:hypothetical protein